MRNSRIQMPRHLCRLSCITGLLLLAGVLAAQDYRARVQGTISDPSQGAISGATVTLRNVNTGIEMVKGSDATGHYLFDFVEPGTYSLTAAATGFSTWTGGNLNVLTGGDVTVDVPLQVGSLTQNVTVAGTAETLQFNTTTLSQTVDGRMLQDLPVLARNPWSLAMVDPSVINLYTTTRNPFYMLAASDVNIGGQTAGRIDILIDGVPVGVGSRGSYTPTMDSVQEFTLQSNTVDAEYGHNAGATLNLSTKAGTNHLHGTAYWFGRNPVLNAVPNSVTHTAASIRNNLWGGAVGGPIIKDKLFTFGSYEQWIQTSPDGTATFTLPTALERTGDYSQSLNASGGLRVVYDPYTTQLSSTGVVTRNPFPGNAIPISRMDPTSLRILQDVWQPNNPGVGPSHTNNYNLTIPLVTHYHNYSDRTDWNISDKWRMFARYSWFRSPYYDTNYANSPATHESNSGRMDATNSAASTVYNINPPTVLSFSMGVTYVEDDWDPVWTQISAGSEAQFWPNQWYQPYFSKPGQEYFYPSINVT